MTQKDRKIVVTPVPRQDIDLKRLARLIIELALEQRAMARKQEGERSDTDDAVEEAA